MGSILPTVTRGFGQFSTSNNRHCICCVIVFVVIMALVDQAATFLHQYVYSWLHSIPSKTPDALKLGVISTAQINPAASKAYFVSL